MPAKKIDDRRLLQQLAHGDKTVSELADFFDVDKSTISKKCNRLKKRGIVTVAAQETLTRRWTHVGNYKIFTLTTRGKQLLRGGEAYPLKKPPKKPLKVDPAVQLNIDDFSPRLRRPEVDVHGLAFKIPIRGRRGRVPVRMRAHRMRNWTKYEGTLNGAYVYITPRHIVIYPRGRGETSEKALEAAKETVKELWMAFRHDFGWEIENTVHCSNPTTGAKWGALYIDTFREVRAPAEGDLALVDNTPTYGTVHAKAENPLDWRPQDIVDTLVLDAKWRQEHRDELVRKQELQAIVKGIIDKVSDVAADRVIHALAEEMKNGRQNSQRATEREDDDEGGVMYG